VDVSYPGERLGMPETGSGSVARFGRRILALGIDWIASMLVASLVLGHNLWTAQGASGYRPLVTMLVFLVEATVLTALLGGSFGQLATRVVVARLDGRPVNLLQALLRTALICLAVPPLIFNRDQRGLHDLATGTVTLVR
jgi:uncharacterized RDD family membrane protein YckC